jgi:TrmH family RNA methyltransferase
MKAITSDANPSFRRWLKLATEPRAARTEQRALAEGIHLAQAAIDARMPIFAALLRRGSLSSLSSNAAQLASLMAALDASGAPRFELAAPLFDRLSPVRTSVGLIVEIGVRTATLPGRLDADLLYLDGIQDPGNAGALLRVAAGAGLGWVLAAPETAALWSPRALRAGQGAHFVLNLVEQIDGVTAGAHFGGAWFAATAHEAESLWKAEIPAGPVAWVFGAEGQGISPPMLALCRRRVRIPLAGVESLNVTSAAAVCLFERRRRLAG